MINLYDYKQELEKDGIIFSFSGPMTHDVIEGMGSAIRIKIVEEEGGDRNAALKVFATFVEQVENVIHYSIEKRPKESELSFGMIVVGKKDDLFFICGGNKISTDEVEKLGNYLTKLAMMNKEELKMYYKERRRANREHNSKGAGIGFIEMARKASKPIEFSFQKIDEEYSFFTINIII
jgi:hypothetical protein